MPNTVEYRQALNIIRIESSGHTSIEKWNNSLDQVLKLNAKTGATRVLIDARRQISSPNTLHLFDFAASLPVALRFAVVVSATIKNDLDFVETVGRNRGKSIRLFGDYDQALDWLDRGNQAVTGPTPAD